MADNEQPRGTGTTPLLFLLDGVLSQDDDRISEAMAEISKLVHISPHQDDHANTSNDSSTGAAPSSSPSCCSTVASLCHVLNGVLEYYPEMASMRSDHDGSLPLHFAASLGNVEVARILLSKCPAAARAPNSKGKIPLHYAAREGRLDMVQFFLYRNPETASIATDKGKLAVHFAAGEGHAQITSTLLWEYPQSAALPSAKGKLPLHFCARWGYIDIAHELLGIYPDAVRALDWEGSLPLHDAAREGQYKMARYLMERFPVALQTANLRGELPLFSAVRSHHTELVSLMILAWPKGGKYILQHVSADDTIDSWPWEIVELLLRGAVNNLQDSPLLEGREPLTVQLTDDVPPQQQTNVGVAAVASISESERKAQKKARKMKAAQSDGQQQPRLLEAPLRWLPAAPTTGPFASLEAKESSPILQSAVESVNSSRPNMPEVQDSGGGGGVALVSARSKSPILNEQRMGAKKVSSRKRSHSTDEFLSSDRTFYPLHAAFQAKASCEAILYVLKKCVAENNTTVCAKDEHGRTALHWAVAHCQDESVATLVLRNANYFRTPMAANLLDRSGRLPLHIAICARAHVRIIMALLHANPASGVRKCITPGHFYGKTPIHMAVQYDCDLSTIFELLKVDPSFVR